MEEKEIMGPLPKEHPRSLLMRKCEIELDKIIHDCCKKYDLTTSEYIQLINRVMSSAIASIMRSCIRQERHGSTDKPGDVE